MQPKILIISLSIIALLSAAVYLVLPRPIAPPDASNTVTVVASFYPLAEFAHQVGGDDVTVVTIVPAGSEPHEYEPTPQQVARVYDADLLLYNGNGIDPWAERIAAEVAQRGVLVMNMSDRVSLLPTVGDDAGAAAVYDPHFWLDPILAQTEVISIRDALVAIDPIHTTTYHQNAAAYLVALQQLDQDYRHALNNCVRRDIVTSHAAFGYLAARYNLSVTTIAGLSPEAEPSARQIATIAAQARAQEIQYIFFETLVSPKLAQTVAAEIGAQTLVFNPLEGLTTKEQQAGVDYLSVMRSNLQNLQRALECEAPVTDTPGGIIWG